MAHVRLLIVAALVGLTVSLVPFAARAGDPAVKCESGKLKEAGKYGNCRLKADSKGVKKGEAADYTKCVDKFTDKWGKVETKAGSTVCPSEADVGSIDLRITTDAAEIATLLAGGILPACGDTSVDAGEQCDGIDLAGADCTTLGFTGGTLACDGSCFFDLSACTAGGGGLVPGVDPILAKTGQATCYDIVGPVISCIGTGQDGEVQAGQARTFTDNTDGTFTDDAIGLMWEAKCDGASCGTLHDKDTTYTWDQAFTSHVATLNSMSFAGHNDWRVPNFLELLTLWDMDKHMASPPTTFAELDSCQADCDVTSCNCTAACDCLFDDLREGRRVMKLKYLALALMAAVTGGIVIPTF
jgi:hypothetical protein